MHDALRMHKHLYFICFNAEQPFSFNHFEALVHHGGRVYCDFRTHVPGGMSQCIGLCNFSQLLFGKQSEGSAASSKQNLFNGIVALAHNALEDGRVLTVNRKNGCAMSHCQLINQLTSHNEGFFIGQAYFFMRLNSVDSWLKTRETNHCREHHVDGFGLYDVAKCLLTSVNLDIRTVG